MKCMNYGFSITLQPLQGATQTPLDELQPQVWDMLCDYNTRFTGGVRRLLGRLHAVGRRAAGHDARR